MLLKKIFTFKYGFMLFGVLSAGLLYKFATDRRSFGLKKDSRASFLPSQSQIVFYNRVAKCGSRSLLDLAKRLSRENLYRYSSSTNYAADKTLGYDGMLNEIKKIANLKAPTFYNRQIHYLDFKKHGFRTPIYINLIRDPIDRFASQYNFKKYGDNKRRKTAPEGNYHLGINQCVMNGTGPCNVTSNLFFRTLQFFCGYDNVCANSSRASAKLAKKHIHQDYLFVGILEEFETSLLILEKLLPKYFSGAVDQWRIHQDVKNVTTTRRLDELTEEAKTTLRSRHMVFEYEVYNFAKRKFNSLKKKYGIS